MSRYDGLIIPRSYSEYINKTDAATLQQALQLSGVLSNTVASGDNKAVRSSAVKSEITKYYPTISKGSVTDNSVTKKAMVFDCLASKTKLLFEIKASPAETAGFQGTIIGYRGSTIATVYIYTGIAVLYQAYNTIAVKIKGIKGSGTFAIGTCVYNEKTYIAIKSGANSKFVFDGLFFSEPLNTDVDTSSTSDFVEAEFS